MNTKKVLLGIITGVMILVGTALPTFAASMTNNGSFEEGVDPGPFFSTLIPGDTNIDGWEIVSGSVDYIGGLWEAAEGERSIDVTGFSPGTITQDITTIPGLVYKVTFDMAGNPDGAPVIKTMNAEAADTSVSFEFDATGHTRADMGWEPREFEFTAVDTTTTLMFASTISGFYGPTLDNVAVGVVLPTDANACKKGGWQSYGVFKNQGDCVSYVETGARNQPAAP